MSGRGFTASTRIITYLLGRYRGARRSHFGEDGHEPRRRRLLALVEGLLCQRSTARSMPAITITPPTAVTRDTNIRLLLFVLGRPFGTS